jgi:tetratricopeptide (TPR) repeat protein
VSAADFKKAVSLHEAGQFGEAAAIYRDILLKEPNNISVLHLLALIAMQHDNAQLVLSLSEAGLKIEPKFALLHQDKATALRRLGFKEKALESIKQALLLDPTNADFFETLASIQRDMRQYDEAVQSLKTAIRLNPTDPKFHNSLSIVLGRYGHNEEALAHINTYIALKPKKAEGYSNRGNILKALGRYREALEDYARALSIDPDIFMGRANKAMSHLVLGEWEEGWELFEGRLPGNQPPEMNRFDKAKRWNGEAAQGKTLIIYNEQGMGDTIQFCRYIPELQKTGAHLIFQVQGLLLSLMRQNWPAERFISMDDPLPPYDLQCPFMSLPRIYKTRPDNVALSSGYVQADAAKVAGGEAQLAGAGMKKIGLVWAGNPDHMNDHIRSIRLEQFAPILKLPGMRFFSLQKGEQAAAQIAALPEALRPTDLSSRLNDFTDTAAILKNLDLLISVDTSVLHLAGALGVPAAALIQFDPDWRWMVGRDDTPWYASVRLYRQAQFGDWGGVIGKLAEILAKG